MGVVGVFALATIGIILIRSIPSTNTAAGGGTSRPIEVSPTAAALQPGLSEDEAIAIAREYVPADATHVSSRHGRHQEVYVDPDEVLDEVTANQQVWALGFESEFEICPPDGSDCIHRPGTTTVILDYFTGNFISSYGLSRP